MKVMFIASIRGKKDHQDAFMKIIQTLENSGNEVFHEHVTSYEQANLDKFTPQQDTAFHNEILAKIRSCDVVISECSYQSLSVGYLISYAIELSKPTIIFYSSNVPKPNLFPTLSQSEKLMLVDYKDTKSLPDLVTEYLEFAKLKVDVRFNFFISPRISNYLDWVTKSLKLPRSVYLRQLIEDDMRRHQEFGM